MRRAKHLICPENNHSCSQATSSLFPLSFSLLWVTRADHLPPSNPTQSFSLTSHSLTNYLGTIISDTCQSVAVLQPTNSNAIVRIDNRLTSKRSFWMAHHRPILPLFDVSRPCATERPTVFPECADCLVVLMLCWAEVSVGLTAVNHKGRYINPCWPLSAAFTPPARLTAAWYTNNITTYTPNCLLFIYLFTIS